MFSHVRAVLVTPQVWHLALKFVAFCSIRLKGAVLFLMSYIHHMQWSVGVRERVPVCACVYVRVCMHGYLS